MPEDNNTIKNLARIYGFMAQPTPEEQAVPARINDMLQSQWQQASDRRTDAAKMAKFAALGNVLQTAFVPVGWAAGGSNNGVVSTTQTPVPDQQGYITAFNNIQRADQDIANIGKQGDQLKLNYAMQEAENARSRREKDRDRIYNYATTLASEQREHERNKELAQIRHDNRLSEYQAKADLQTSIEELKARLRYSYKITDRQGKDLDEYKKEMLIRGYEKARSDYSRGLTDYLPSFDEYVQMESGRQGWAVHRGYENTARPGRSSSTTGTTRTTGGGSAAASGSSDNTPPSRRGTNTGNDDNTPPSRR